MKPFVNYRVFIGIVPTGYLDSEKTSEIIREGIIYCQAATELETLKPKNIHVKPRFIILDENSSKNSCTHSSVVESALKHLKEFSPKSSTKVFIEKNQYGISNSELIKELKYENFPILFDEATEQVQYIYTKDVKSQFHKCTTSSFWLKSDYTVFAPKIIGDSLTEGFSGAIRLGLDNSIINFEPEQVSQFLEIAFPNLVIGDGIYLPISGGRATQQAQELGLILVSNNPVAHDIVAANILNLDYTKIEHIFKAISAGWGPSSLQEIELGGAGDLGMKQLMQKSRSFRSAKFSLSDLKQKYEYENPGLKFPFEILENTSNSNSNQKVLSNIFLDSISMAMDSVKHKTKISKWPKWTICLGEVSSYPKRKTVICLNKEAFNSLKTLSSEFKQIYKFKKITFNMLTLKNGDSHFVINIDAGNEHPYLTLALSFFMVSLFRIRFPILKIKTLIRIYQNKQKPIISDKIILTGNLPHNEWWTYLNKNKKEQSLNANA